MNEITNGVPGMPRDIRPLLMGAQLPRVTLTDIDGADRDLGSLIAGKPVIMVVYRGGW